MEDVDETENESERATFFERFEIHEGSGKRTNFKCHCCLGFFDDQELKTQQT